ncbi:hypothetical protein BN946_scf184991.g1, partial [Trametes cinnabarina]
EAVERQQAYIAWRLGLLEEELELAGLYEELEDVSDDLGIHGENEDGEGSDGDEMQGGDADDVAVEGSQAVPRADEEVKALRELMNSNVTRAYQLPLTPNARRVSLDTLISDYAAVDFLLELNDYLGDNHPQAPLATEYTKFDLFHSITLLLPANIHLANEKRVCKLRASPAVPRIRDRKAVPARFDCGLFVFDDDAYRTEGGLSGLRPGQVRAIFCLPAWMGCSEPLVGAVLLATDNGLQTWTDINPASQQWFGVVHPIAELNSCMFRTHQYAQNPGDHGDGAIEEVAKKGAPVELTNGVGNGNAAEGA